MPTIDEYQDVLDVRDIIARVEELESERDDHEEERVGGELSMLPWQDVNPDDAEELRVLSALLDDLKGYGGDEQWRGDWYPVTLIRDSYFKDYAQELADDIGAIDANAGWPYTCIDWERAARELRMDYSSVEYNGVDYWYR